MADELAQQAKDQELVPMSTKKTLIKLVKILEEMRRGGLIKNYSLAGGFAAIAWGMPRTTLDIDVLLDMDLKKIREVVSFLRRKGLDVQSPLGEVKITAWIDDTRIDLILPFEKIFIEAIKYSFLIKIWGYTVPSLRPEFLILTKLLALRHEDIADISWLMQSKGLNVGRLRALARKFNLLGRLKRFL